jgi:hypothetical protein
MTSNPTTTVRSWLSSASQRIGLLSIFSGAIPLLRPVVPISRARTPGCRLDPGDTTKVDCPRTPVYDPEKRSMDTGSSCGADPPHS